VTSQAFSLGPGMRHLGLVDLLHLIAVTSGAKCFCVGVGQDNFAVFCGRVADLAGLIGKRRMRESLHQLRQRRLVRIVALRAGGRRKRLPLVSLDEGGILDVVTVDTEGRNRLGQVIVEFLFPLFADLVRNVAGIATHVEGGVAAAFFRDVQTLVVTIEAQILALLSCRGFQQLILVFGYVRIVALEAIANGGSVYCALDVGGVLVGVAGKAEAGRRCRDQLDARDILVDTNLVTTGAAHRNRRVDRLPFGLIAMTLNTFR